MDNISINQALDVWSDLWQAYYGKNGFGSNTAEIYAYKIMPNSPKFSMNINSPENKKLGLLAAKSLYQLLFKFRHENDCKIEIMETRTKGQKIGRWFTKEPFFYRCHIKITPKRARK